MAPAGHRPGIHHEPTGIRFTGEAFGILEGTLGTIHGNRCVDLETTLHRDAAGCTSLRCRQPDLGLPMHVLRDHGTSGTEGEWELPALIEPRVGLILLNAQRTNRRRSCASDVRQE